jgi:Tfp pilus assembly protein PilF
MDVDQNPRSAVQQLDLFLKTYPDSPWGVVAHTAMGRAYERLGDGAAAHEHYSKATADPFVGAASRLMPAGPAE